MPSELLQLLARDAGCRLLWGGVDPAESISVSEAAMSNLDAFTPLLKRIHVPPAVVVPMEQLLPPRDEPTTLDGP